MKFILALILVAACTGPEEVLQNRGRPGPITCAKTGQNQKTCTDGAGVIWTCFTGDPTAECIATGQLPKEAP